MFGAQLHERDPYRAIFAFGEALVSAREERRAADAYVAFAASCPNGEGEQNLARFNMPLELGMAMARRFATTPEDHDWLVLVPNGHLHQKVISDLSGYDPKGHDGTLEDIVRKVMAWLVTRPDAAIAFTPGEVLAKLPMFQEQVQKLRADWGEDLPWSYLVSAAKSIAEQLL